MFMSLLRCPRPHVLLADMPTQMKTAFVTKQNQAKITWVVFNSLTGGLIKPNPFFLIGISLFLEDMHVVWKQLYVAQLFLKCQIPETVVMATFCSNCLRCFLTAWTLACVLAVTCHPLQGSTYLLEVLSWKVILLQTYVGWIRMKTCCLTNIFSP